MAWASLSDSLSDLPLGLQWPSAWGLPSALYLDNGSEYRWADFVDDAMKLIARVTFTDDRDSRVVRARPYNAPAKAIEGIGREGG